MKNAIMASAQANATKKHVEEEIAKTDAEVAKGQKAVRDYIKILHQREVCTI